MTKQLHHMITRGTRVEVTEPLHPQSKHSGSFLGEVCYCHQDHVLVKDSEDHTFDVFLDEILCLRSFEGNDPCYCLRLAEHGYDVVIVQSTGMVETLGASMDKAMATHILDMLSQPAEVLWVAA